MKKAIITLLVLLGIIGVAVVTCPDRQAHKDAIMAVANEIINESSDPNDVLDMIFSPLSSRLADYFLNDRFRVENHFLWSTGILKDYDGEDLRVSVGVFGHVFTGDKEDVKKVIDEVL